MPKAASSKNAVQHATRGGWGCQTCEALETSLWFALSQCKNDTREGRPWCLSTWSTSYPSGTSLGLLEAYSNNRCLIEERRHKRGEFRESPHTVC
jgi:hypothetical protein